MIHQKILFLLINFAYKLDFPDDVFMGVRGKLCEFDGRD